MLGIVELGVVLGLLDLLFLAFVVVQFRYLFGGADLVQVSATLTYAEYARRGFFELVTVSALLLSVMLLLDWLARLDRPREVTVYRMLAGLLGVLLFVVIVSALQRMRLYTQEYGLTELRLYTTAFMLWIAAGGVWYVLTVLRDHRERFLFGTMVAGLAVAAILNAINPDDLIVRTNAQRTDAPTRFDGVYGTRLSADADAGADRGAALHAGRSAVVRGTAAARPLGVGAVPGLAKLELRPLPGVRGHRRA